MRWRNAYADSQSMLRLATWDLAVGGSGVIGGGEKKEGTFCKYKLKNFWSKKEVSQYKPDGTCQMS